MPVRFPNLSQLVYTMHESMPFDTENEGKDAGATASSKSSALTPPLTILIKTGADKTRN